MSKPAQQRKLSPKSSGAMNNLQNKLNDSVNKAQNNYPTQPSKPINPTNPSGKTDETQPGEETKPTEEVEKGSDIFYNSLHAGSPMYRLFRSERAD